MRRPDRTVAVCAKTQEEVRVRSRPCPLPKPRLPRRSPRRRRLPTKERANCPSSPRRFPCANRSPNRCSIAWVCRFRHRDRSGSGERDRRRLRAFRSRVGQTIRRDERPSRETTVSSSECASTHRPWIPLLRSSIRAAHGRRDRMHPPRE